MLRDFVVVAVVGSIIAGLHQTCAAGAVSQRQQRTGAQAELDVPHFSLDDLLSDDDFAETEFIVLSQHEATRESAHTEASNGVEVDMATFEVHSHGDSAMTQRNSAAGNGVVCETVCRPRTASASDEGPPSDDTSEASSSFLELNSDSDGDDVSMLQQRVRSLIEALQIQQAEQVAVLARSFNRSLCAASGGGWDSERSVCAPFMHASPTTVASCDGTRVFEACSGDFVDGNGVAHAGGSVGDYVPCSPFQALALAHVQQDSVPEQAYFWLWAGGKADQVDSAAFKQDVGHNPATGLDRCADGERIGMFHNWDGHHVDSWSCLDCTHELPVLCCRR